MGWNRMDAYIRDGYVRIVLWRMRLGLGCSSWTLDLVLVMKVRLFSNLEMVDVDVESAASTFSQRVGEFLVSFAENAVLGIFQ